jgi:chemotaxis protein MotB
MSASGGGRKKRGGHGGDHADERWLLTYADMLTLMFALFMVLFSISSVNISKYQTLQKSLKAAFSGSILPGGKAILRSGSTNSSAHSPSQAEVPSIVAVTRSASPSTDSMATRTSVNYQLNNAMAAAAAGDAEQAGFDRLKAKLDVYAKQHGFGNAVQTVVAKNGLTVRVLTDNLLFGSGSAVLKPAGLPLLAKVAQLLNVDRTHPITVAGHTDNQPIHTAQYATNWQLSTDRATNVVLYLIQRGVRARRLGAAGYADLHPIAGNDTPRGRAENRRVEITLQRVNPFPSA